MGCLRDRVASWLALTTFLTAVGCDGRSGGEGDASTDANRAPWVLEFVDPACLDGEYVEGLPTYDADLSDLEAAYDPAEVTTFIAEVLERRYPFANELIEGGRRRLACDEAFLGDTRSLPPVYRRIGVVVHECGHLHDLTESSGATNAYVVNETLRYECSGGDSTQRGGFTFARSRIREDAFQSRRPDDFYADTYLNGDPDDNMFQGGDQGFNLLFEEVVQYVNSLATGYAFQTELDNGGRVSEKDGILTFLWYTMRYLRMARLDYPDAYQHILEGDGGCWRRAVLEVWGRAWLFLEAAEGLTHLQIAEAELLELVGDPELLGEIQRLREAEGCR